MSKNFHKDYADTIGHFVESLPPQAGVSAQEVDAYFRACALCLWSTEAGGDVAGVSQIYTDKPVRFTPEQFKMALAHYRDNPTYLVGEPPFFRKLTAWDRDHGSSFSRNFAEIQKNLLMLLAAYDGSFSFDESRRITRMYRILTDACDRVGVAPITITPGPEDYLERAPSLTCQPRRDPAKELTEIMDEFTKVIARDKSRNMYDDFFGGQKPPMKDPRDPLPVEPEGGPAEPEKTAPGQPAEGEKGPEAPEEPPRPTLEEAMAELDQLIGLETVKKDVDSLVNLVKVRALRKERGLKCPDMSFHLVFSGNPGTGKTTVARIVGKIYSALGLLSKGHLVEVDRSGLVAGYVGQTAIKTQEVIQKALGGVLFIDEAYSLAPENADKDFGQEAIDTILKAMEDHRDDFVVIVAGYASLMPRFIDSNPGLKSRFNKYLYFEDYDGTQLYDIFLGRVERNDYRLDDAAAEAVKEHLTELYEDRDENFGNARDVRNLFEKIVANQADRVAKLEAPTDEDILTITTADLTGLMDLPLAEEKKGDKEEKTAEKGPEAAN